VGGGGSAQACKLTVAELEQQRRASDTARIRGSYRWLHQGLKPQRAFARHESHYYRDLEASRSRDPPPRRSSSHDLEASSSSAPALRRLTFSEGSSSSAPPPPLWFDPGDYAEDVDIAAIAAKLEMAAPALKAGDFVPDAALGTVTALVEEKIHRDADKQAEWLRQSAHNRRCSWSTRLYPFGRIR
jgi:hypothetical protein